MIVDVHNMCGNGRGGAREREKKIRRKKTLINTLGLAGNVGGDEMCEG